MGERVATGVSAVPVDLREIGIGVVTGCATLVVVSPARLQAAVVVATIEQVDGVVHIDVSQTQAQAHSRRGQGQLSVDGEEGRIEGGVLRLAGREHGQEVIGADVARIDVGIQPAVVHCDFRFSSVG